MLIDIILNDLTTAAQQTGNDSFKTTRVAIEAMTPPVPGMAYRTAGHPAAMTYDDIRPLLEDALKAMPLTCANIHTAQTQYQQNTSLDDMSTLDRLILEVAGELMGAEAPVLKTINSAVFHTQIIEALDRPRGPRGPTDYAVREALDSLYKSLIEKAKEQMVDQDHLAKYAEVLQLAFETYAGLASLVACQHKPAPPAEGDDTSLAHIDILIHTVATEVHEKTANQQPPLRQFTHPTLLKGTVGEIQRVVNGFVVPQFGIDNGELVTTGLSPFALLSASKLEIHCYADDHSIAPVADVQYHRMSDNDGFEQDAWLITFFPGNWDVLETCVVPVIDLDKMVAYLCLGHSNDVSSQHWLYSAFPKMDMDPEHIVGYVTEAGLKLACAAPDVVNRIMTLVMDSRCCNYPLETIPATDELHEILANACGLKTPWSTTREQHGGKALVDALLAAYFGHVTKDMEFESDLIAANSALCAAQLIKLGLVQTFDGNHVDNVMATTHVGTWVFENTKTH